MAKVEEDMFMMAGREAKPLERCMSCRQDIFGEDEKTARRTCQKMLNDSKFRHIIIHGTPEQLGLAFHEWALWHDPEWAWWREKKAWERRGKGKSHL